MRQASAYMNQGGSLVLEMAPEQREGLEKAALGLFPDGRVSVAKDLQGLDRVLVIDTGRR
ncbi:MAG: hypothetical protein HYU29_02395 [Chloroflexi bacterium]|nr:hypothetical protein [Chloroflexota bacterium]